MIDMNYMEKNFDEVAEKLMKRGVDKDFLFEIKTNFNLFKKIKQEEEFCNGERNKLTKEFAQMKRENKEVDKITIEINIVKDKIKDIKKAKEKIEENYFNAIKLIPNIPDDRVPVGKDEKGNIEIKKVLEPKRFNFKPKNHWEIENGWIDNKRGVKLAKTRFNVLKGQGAILERALINFFLDENRKAGFEEVSVPYLNKYAMLEGTGQFPKFENDTFKIEGEDLYLIPTAEVPLTNMFNDEIIPKDELPILMTAHTPCFRREAGSAGKDTRGMIRQHQFHKVEMVAITTPEQAEEIFNKMIKQASDLLIKLEIPHRLVELCTGDLGFSAKRTVDIEIWLPGEGLYREIASISNTGNFQAKRAKIRFKDGKDNLLVNTLNGSALAVGRTIVGIMENYQNEDGTIDIPKVLRKYL